jgi:hypothetical protein
MKTNIKLFVFGFITAVIIIFGSIIGFLYLFSSDDISTIHEQILPSGKHIRVTMCNLVWGAEHDERFPDQDCFALEYISSMSNFVQQTRDSETLEVFELIRPLSEQWGFDKAEISVFPSAKRKGIYYIYFFKRNSDGRWTFDQHSTKVHIND